MAEAAAEQPADLANVVDGAEVEAAEVEAALCCHSPPHRQRAAEALDGKKAGEGEVREVGEMRNQRTTPGPWSKVVNQAAEVVKVEEVAAEVETVLL